MEDIKNRIEAVLFTTGRFLTIDELSELVGIASKGLIKDTLSQLTEDYKNKNSSLEILEENNKFKLNIKKDYLYLTTKLLNETEFDRPVQETLALVAYKQPVLQSEIVDMRGNTCYDHIKRLKELEFITSEKSGRTRLLKTTQKFYDYFDVVGTQLKEKLNEAEKVEEKTDVKTDVNKTEKIEERSFQEDMFIEKKKRAQKIKKAKEEIDVIKEELEKADKKGSKLIDDIKNKELVNSTIKNTEIKEKSNEESKEELNKDKEKNKDFLEENLEENKNEE